METNERNNLELLDGMIEQVLINGSSELMVDGSAPADNSRAVAYKITRIFSEDMDGYTRLPGWHSVEQLGHSLTPLLDLDADYCAGENLHFLMNEGLASISLQIRELLRCYKSDPCSNWDQDTLPKLQELHRFAIAVLLGTTSVAYPNKTIKDFS